MVHNRHQLTSRHLAKSTPCAATPIGLELVSYHVGRPTCWQTGPHPPPQPSHPPPQPPHPPPQPQPPHPPQPPHRPPNSPTPCVRVSAPGREDPASLSAPGREDPAPVTLLSAGVKWLRLK